MSIMPDPTPDLRRVEAALGVGGPLAEFDKAIRDVTERRGKVYGHPSKDFDRIARLKAVVAECKDPLVRHALEMILVKVARLVESPDHIDSWVDIAGYARTAVMCIDKATWPGQAPTSRGTLLGGIDWSKVDSDDGILKVR